MTTAGLRFTREAFAAWEALRAEGIGRRGPRKSAKPEDGEVVDLTAQRIKVLERAGMRRRG
jgi:hypothetical protein